MDERCVIKGFLEYMAFSLRYRVFMMVQNDEKSKSKMCKVVLFSYPGKW